MGPVRALDKSQQFDFSAAPATGVDTYVATQKGIRVGASAGANHQKGDTGETSVYGSPKGRPFAMDCGTISPASTSTFVRMANPLNAEFLTISGVIDMGLATASGRLKMAVDDQSGATTTSTESTQSIGFDEDLYYRDGAEALKAVHQMLLARIISRQ